MVDNGLKRVSRIGILEVEIRQPLLLCSRTFFVQQSTGIPKILVEPWHGQARYNSLCQEPSEPYLMHSHMHLAYIKTSGPGHDRSSYSSESKASLKDSNSRLDSIKSSNRVSILYTQVTTHILPEEPNNARAKHI